MNKKKKFFLQQILFFKVFCQYLENSYLYAYIWKNEKCHFLLSMTNTITFGILLLTIFYIKKNYSFNIYNFPSFWGEGMWYIGKS